MCSSQLIFLTYCRMLVVLDKYHWMLYFLVTAMYPRFLITLDEELNNFPVTVRVGQVRPSEEIIVTTSTYLSFPGCRRCRSSGQTTNHIWLPNALNARAVGHHRASRAGDGGVYPLRARTRGFRHLAEKSRLGEGGQDGIVELYHTSPHRSSNGSVYLSSALFCYLMTVSSLSF